MARFLFNENTMMALSSIRSNKTRSLLTVIGIIIGVSSVVMIISLGEGLRRQIIKNSYSSDTHAITIRPGKLADRDKDGDLRRINYLAGMTANSLSEKDYQDIKKIKDSKEVVPLATISGVPSTYDNKKYNQAVIVATTPEYPSLINQKIAYGGFFKDDNSARNSVIIGKRVAENLFEENVPLGKLINIRGQDFVVGGVFEEFETSPLSAVTDLNKAVFVSYGTVKTVIKADPSIYQISVLPKNGVSENKLVSGITNTLRKNHGGQEDFTVLTYKELEKIAHQTVSIATTFVAAIAGISLLVGGVGVMNIMFVSVTERTKEIGVRKSIGATNQQIYNQFLVEALTVSIFGGVLGLVVGVVGNFIIHMITSFQPVLSWQVICFSIILTASIGVIFGTAPALKAARKDPIESLRYE